MDRAGSRAGPRAGARERHCRRSRRILVLEFSDCRGAGPVARRVFKQLGYRVTTKVFPDVYAFVGALAKSGAHGPQAGAQGWIADYPAASNFFAIMSCATAGDHANNAARFCSPRLDAEVKWASALQARDPGAAARLWIKVDRDATDLAAIAPTVTLRAVDVVSKRVGNYQYHPLWGVLLDQIWVCNATRPRSAPRACR